VKNLRKSFQLESNLNVNIQQLRGIAVISVILFHLNLNYAKTGFLGVDTFFVISGFLMAMIYGRISDLKTASTFFYKRAVRLLPAYWFTIISTTIITILICLPHEVATVNKHGIWAILFLPNVGFWADAEYWGGSQFRPFLHLWSLGVEFQFYLIYPVLSRYVDTNIKRILLLFVSLSLYIGVDHISAKTAFYMMPTRLWQFMLGILAFELTKKINFKYSNKIFSILLLILLLVLLLPITVSPNSVYLLTIPTTFLAASTMIFSTSQRINLSNKPIENFLAWIGKYSFSIYLMHFPIILFLRYKPFGGTTTGLTSIMQYVIFLLLLLILSKFTFSVFEKHKIFKLSCKKLLSFGILTLILVVALGRLAEVVSENQFSKKTLQISNAWLDQSEYRCGKLFRFLHPIAKYCPIGDKDHKERYLLIGNSHADSIKNTLGEQLNSRDISLFLNVQNSAMSSDQVDNILNAAKSMNFSKIIFHARSGTTNLDSLERILPKLNELSVKTYYLLPVPEYGFSIPEEMYRNISSGKELSSISVSDYLMMNNSEIKRVNELSKKFGIRILDTPSIFCTPVCKVSDSEGLYYFDGGHLTLHGSRQLTPVFAQLLEN
jgi:peptidoglycan/LPS O-acetylase OafA/YrhL